jgi:hypothetical protein
LTHRRRPTKLVTLPIEGRQSARRHSTCDRREMRMCSGRTLGGRRYRSSQMVCCSARHSLIGRPRKRSPRPKRNVPGKLGHAQRQKLRSCRPWGMITTMPERRCREIAYPAAKARTRGATVRISGRVAAPSVIFSSWRDHFGPCRQNGQFQEHLRRLPASTKWKLRPPLVEARQGVL